MVSGVVPRPIPTQIRQVALLAILVLIFSLVCSFGFGNASSRSAIIYTALKDLTYVSEKSSRSLVLGTPDTTPKRSESTPSPVMAVGNFKTTSVQTKHESIPEPAAKNDTLISNGGSQE